MYKYYFLLLACAIFWKDGSCKKSSQRTNDVGGKIVGGYSVTIDKAPYQAYLLLEKGKEYYQCGGSIISKRHILTAAHCLVDNISQVHARVGSTNNDKGGKVYSTKSMTIHPNYNSRTYDYDVAILTFSQDIAIDGVNTKIVTLPSENNGAVPAKTTLFVTGWGATSEGGDSSKTLLAVNVPTLSVAECKKSVSNFSDRMLCAGVSQGGKDACQGDSGGPAVSNNVQLGVVSFGSGCARPGNPGVYANVTALRGWIRKTAGV
uniref:trypsin n=1 Tax=Antheraea pernyi TaxID=7119 RepID=D6QUQ4_ANTPE|nr:cocoonase-like protein [Antheraea pernyi]WAH05999.1 cocoonase [Antheraea mylitta]